MKKMFTLFAALTVAFTAFSQKDLLEKVNYPDGELPTVRKANAPAVKGDATIDITITTDNYGTETTWELVNTITSTVVGSGGPYTDASVTYDESFSVNSADCYTFTIYDAYGDGICCTYGNGSYTVEYNGTVVGSGGSFNSEESVLGIGGGCPTEEIVLTEITMAEYGAPNTDIPVTGIIFSEGTDNLTSFDVTYNIDGGTEVTEFNVSGINIAIGDSYEFTHDVPVNIDSDGNYVINVTISNPNGVADNTNNNTLSHNLMLSSNAVTRKVLLENFTTAQCPNCPPAHNNLNTWLTGETNVIWLAHHAGYYTDDWTVPENTELLAFYNDGGATYAPAIMLDRKFLSPDGDPGPVFFPASTYTPDLINDRVNTPSFISLNITGDFDEDSKELIVGVNGTFHGDFTQNLRVGLYIMEDGLEGDQAGATGTYTHNHVMRDAISGTFGDDISSSTLTGETFSTEYTYTVDASWIPENCHLVAWISKWDASNINNREILQASKAHLTELVSSIESFDIKSDIYPNPNAGALNINKVKGANIQIINQLGQVVYTMNNAENVNRIDISNLPNGTYFIKIILDKEVSTKKIVLNK